MADGDQEVFRVVTANRLRDGAIVYLNRDAGWSESIGDATVASDAEIDDLVARAEEDVKSNLVVGAYTIEIAGDHQPLSARERIRAQGPSIRFGEDALPANNSDFEI
jgi:sulfite reductase (NADPH) hemoprotein beta-component